MLLRFTVMLKGSPPPMRGKETAMHATEPADRITPAHAGKSRNICTGMYKETDHPRPCGEKQRTGDTFLFMLGSPPPMRGKVCGCVQKDF